MKTFKRLAAFLLVMAVTLLSSGTLKVRAEDHYMPGSNKPCNNTYRTYKHFGYMNGYHGENVTSRHVISTGVTCNIIAVIYDHQVCCTACQAVVSLSTYACTTKHSICNIFIQTCN